MVALEPREAASFPRLYLRAQAGCWELPQRQRAVALWWTQKEEVKGVYLLKNVPNASVEENKGGKHFSFTESVLQ